MTKLGRNLATIPALVFAFVTLISAPLLAQQKDAPPPVRPLQAGKDVSKRDFATQNGRNIKEDTLPDALHGLNTSLQSLTARVSPAIVEILVSGFGPVDQQSSRTAYYGRQHSLGSGVILDPNGYIMTNAHVLEGAQRVQVVLAQSAPPGRMPSGPMRIFEARLIGSDRDLDLALIKIEATNLPYLPMADVRRARQGELVLAIGSPQGLQNSVTLGVVSALARQPDPDRPMIYIQTDAPINPGNSGGALIDVDGHLLGINTFIYTQGGGSEGLGFAIPEPVVRLAYDSFKKRGHIDRPELGISAQTITPMMAEALGLQRGYGVIISDVVPGTPAAKVGLGIGDILLTVDDREISSLPMLQAALYSHPAEMPADVEVLRGEKKLNFEVPVITHKHALDQVASATEPQQAVIRQLGVVAATVDKTVADMVGGQLRETSGALVVARTIAAAAIDSDLQPGDIIHTLNLSRVARVEDLVSALNNIHPGDFVVMQIERQGQLQFMTSEVD
jgi:serine protease Do